MVFKPWIPLVFVVMILVSTTVAAKVVTPTAPSGQNRVYIRADGLACYFCAYGMERFFKQSGRIAWYDMDMEAGVVVVGFIKGKPILPVKTLKRFVHDAGFSPREIRVEFLGRFVHEADRSFWFEVTETDQRFPVQENEILHKASPLYGSEVILKGRAEEHHGAPLLLVPERVMPVDGL